MALAAAGLAAPAPQGRIDCQSHLFVPELLAWMEKRRTPPYVYRKGEDRYVVVGEWERRILPNHTDVAAKLAAMDSAGIELAALSINDPGPELFGKDAVAIARMVNDYIDSVARRHPRRFFGLAALPMQDNDSTLAELDRCIGKPGLKGILLYSNLNGRFPDEPQFRPLFETAARRNIPILLHPAYPVTHEATKGYSMAAGLGLMFDTTIALTRLILAGVLERHPDLKLVCPHVGGALPYLIGRIDHQTQVLKRGAENIRKPPSEYLKQVWLDTVSPIAQAIRYGIDFAGVDKMLYASDHPWVDPSLIAGLVSSLKLSPADERKVFAENARRLFGLSSRAQS
ncbi:MAG: amidohydrolase family protein [Acidobacteriota bacterium]